MNRGRWLWAAVALGLGAVLAGQEAADRTASVRTGGKRSSGARSDMTVPYLNNGKNAFNGSNVAPKIYASPVIDEPNNPQAKPVFNLIFYGSKQNFGDKSNGAGPRPANQLRPPK